MLNMVHFIVTMKPLFCCAWMDFNGEGYIHDRFGCVCVFLVVVPAVGGLAEEVIRNFSDEWVDEPILAEGDAAPDEAVAAADFGGK